MRTQLTCYFAIQLVGWLTENIIKSLSTQSDFVYVKGATLVEIHGQWLEGYGAVV